jgi:hypothetical protein
VQGRRREGGGGRSDPGHPPLLLLPSEVVTAPSSMGEGGGEFEGPWGGAASTSSLLDCRGADCPAWPGPVLRLLLPQLTRRANAPRSAVLFHRSRLALLAQGAPSPAATNPAPTTPIKNSSPTCSMYHEPKHPILPELCCISHCMISFCCYQACLVNKEK